MKTHKTFTIDLDICIQMKTNNSINWSNLINEFLKAYIYIKTDNLEYTELKSEIEHLEKTKNSIITEINNKTAALFKLETEKKQNDIELRKRADKKAQAIINSGLLGDIAN